jgi:hypothetical protein
MVGANQMKIKRSELDSLILEVTENNEISKKIAHIIDQQGVDTDEAITIYIKDNPEAHENTVIQAITDFPISNKMDGAFLEEGLETIIDEVLADFEDEDEEEFEDPVIDPLEDTAIEEPAEEPLEEPEDLAAGLYGGEQKFNPDVQRALAIINQVVNEPREYFALMNGQTTPEGMPKYPGVLHMVVMNPREKRRAMRVILGKRLGDLIMDFLEKAIDPTMAQESLKKETDNEDS